MALVIHCNYWNDIFYYGNIFLTSPRLGSDFYSIQLWDSVPTVKLLGDAKYTYPIVKQFYGMLSVESGYAAVNAEIDAAGIVFYTPWPAEYIEFTVDESTYGQYGMCTKDSTLPNIQGLGVGRQDYQVYDKPGTYRINVNGIAHVDCFFITLNKGALRDIKIKMY